jgi:hypothetical protein
MKSKSRKVFYPLLLTALLALSASSSAEAARYYFSQKFTENRQLTGYVDGVDNTSDNSRAEPDGIPDNHIKAFFEGWTELKHLVVNFSDSTYWEKMNCTIYSCDDHVSPYELDYDITNKTLYFYSKDNEAYFQGVLDSKPRLGKRSFSFNPPIDGKKGYFYTTFLPNGNDEIYTDDRSFDAIGPLVVSQTTPVPAALFLFVSAFSGLILLLRSKS